MQVVTVETSAGQTRYYLANDDGTPVEPVLQYLKFRDNGGAARNTLRLACIFMKHYFTYLEKRGLRWQAVTIDDLADFLAWLKYPRIDEKVIPLNLEPKYRAETINAILDTVLAFYHYQYLRGGLDNNVSEKLVTFIKNPHGTYRSFLDGIADRRREKRYLLRLPTPKRVLRTVTKEEVEAVMKACVNVRDYFLMYLLFETGMRIGEALSLWLEDFDISECRIRIVDRGEMENLAEIKTVSSPRTIDCTHDLMEVFTEYICYFHTESTPTNHVFVKIQGKNAGKAMNYTDVDNLFRQIRRKTGIYITPHMFRHTSLSMLSSAGWEPELLRKRAGHKNIYTTLNTYVHPSEEEVTAAFKEAADRFRLPGKEAEE